MNERQWRERCGGHTAAILDVVDGAPDDGAPADGAPDDGAPDDGAPRRRSASTTERFTMERLAMERLTAERLTMERLATETLATETLATETLATKTLATLRRTAWCPAYALWVEVWRRAVGLGQQHSVEVDKGTTVRVGPPKCRSWT